MDSLMKFDDLMIPLFIWGLSNHPGKDLKF
jgi:hypothetical protein